VAPVLQQQARDHRVPRADDAALRAARLHNGEATVRNCNPNPNPKVLGYTIWERRCVTRFVSLLFNTPFWIPQIVWLLLQRQLPLCIRSDRTPSVV
jgi:hypothetical protein